MLICLGKTTDQGVIAVGRRFTYGKVLRVDYEDEDILNILLHAETSKGERLIKLSEDRLVLDFCEPVELQNIIYKGKNMIISLRPFIAEEAAFEDSDDVSSQDAGLELGVRHLPVPVPHRKRTSIPKQSVQNKRIKRIQ